DQRCAIAEMRVSAGKFSGSTLLLRIRHQHEMPMLLVTRGRCLKAIADDGKQEIGVEGRAVKSTAGNTLCYTSKALVDGNGGHSNSNSVTLYKSLSALTRVLTEFASDANCKQFSEW